MLATPPHSGYKNISLKTTNMLPNVGKLFNRVVGLKAARFLKNKVIINSQEFDVQEYDKAGDVLKCSGTVTITDAGSGFAKGCEYIKTDVASGTSATYVNNGTNTSCLFHLVGATSGGGIDSSSTGLVINENYIKYASVALTNAQMLALRAAPITIIAAPGAGKIIEFVSAVLCFDRAGAYTEVDDNMAFKYTDGSGQAISETIECTGFVDAATDAVMPVQPVTSAVILTANGVNKAVVLHNTGGDEFGGGNAGNEVLVKVAYRVHSTGF